MSSTSTSKTRLERFAISCCCDGQPENYPRSMRVSRPGKIPSQPSNPSNTSLGHSSLHATKRR
eukprot:3554044-Pyramimonas_sp.AAC.1